MNREYFPPFLALITTTGFFGSLAALQLVGLPESGRDASLIMLGALGGAWTSIIGYYFGSSHAQKKAAAESEVS